MSVAVTSQKRWQKRLVMLSGPGALSGFISSIAFFISLSYGFRVSVVFMPGVTFAVMYRRASSKSPGCEDVNRFWKYSDAAFSIPYSLSAHPPFGVFSLVIGFGARVCFVMVWKNFVFLSSSFSHSALLFLSPA